MKIPKLSDLFSLERMPIFRKAHLGFLPLVMVLLIFLMATISAFAQNPATKATPQDQEMLLALASQISGSERIDAMLKEFGFPPDGFAQGAAQGYRDWPELRKLQAAYRAAVLADGTSAGKKFLKSFSRLVASRYTNAIRYEKALQEFFPELENTAIHEKPEKINFSSEKTGDGLKLGPELTKILMTLEKYSGTIPGGMQSIMAYCCLQTEEAVIYEILSTSESNKDAMIAALDRSKVPPELQEKIRRMLIHTAERFNSFKYEEMFKPYLSPLDHSNNKELSGLEFFNPNPNIPLPADLVKPSIDDINFDRAISELAKQVAKSTKVSDNAISTLPPMGSGTSSQNSTFYNSTFYNDVRNSVKPPGGASPPPGWNPRSFEVLSKGDGGFGGVVFGNEIRVKDTLKLIEINWVPDPVKESQDRKGRFDFHFSNGMTGYSRKFSEHLVYAAKLLVYDGFGPEYPPLNVGTNEGVGLAGVRVGTGFSYPSFDNGKISRLESGKFVVHPALLGLPIGNAAMEADALSFMASPDWIVEEMRKAGVSQTTANATRDWLNLKGKRGFFKIIDAPLEIRRIEDGSVDVIRQPAKDYSENHRTVALLTTQTFDFWGEQEDEFATPFYNVVPALVHTFDAFNQLNQFSEVFAIIRWAKRDNAKWIGNLSKPIQGQNLANVIGLPSGGLNLTEGMDAVLLTQFRKFIKDVEKYQIDKINQAVSSNKEREKDAQRGRDIAAKLSAHRLEKLKYIFASKRLKELKVNSQKDEEGQIKAIDYINGKAIKENRSELDEIKLLDKEGLGLASPAELQQMEKLLELEEKFSNENIKLISQLRELNSVEGRAEDASPEIRTKIKKLIAERDKIKGQWFLDLGDDERLELDKKFTQIQKALEKILSSLPKSKKIGELESKIEKMDIDITENRNKVKVLQEGPLGAWNEWIKVQKEVTQILYLILITSP